MVAATLTRLDEARARRALERVVDPEIPVLNVLEMGVVREIQAENGRVEVAITPTYSGCPAMHAIALDIDRALSEAGFREVRIRTVVAPAWTTDWLTEAARAKLLAIGIAPPPAAGKRALLGDDHANCPRCGSARTSMLSRFGSTACKAIWRCDACLETFDQFKCI
ncbi:1,2-phenylacetyl-CoA epoxidase subunit PaaD [Desertibaculum subflavum]|uniref:1,2-phenylacetyl-CoA epoxidase subunit PaaD n=1 Tax=Desertibaculum subflavum TaxID=2268458 RepID=UPI000E6721AA